MKTQQIYPMVITHNVGFSFIFSKETSVCKCSTVSLSLGHVSSSYHIIMAPCYSIVRKENTTTACSANTEFIRASINDQRITHLL